MRLIITRENKRQIREKMNRNKGDEKEVNRNMIRVGVTANP